MRKIIIIIVVLFLIVLIGIGLYYLSRKKTQNTSFKRNSFEKGVTLTPKSFKESDFTDFFQKANQAGKIISWTGDWAELGDSQSGSTVLAELSSQYNYEPVYELQFFNQSTGKVLRPLNETNLSIYKSKTVSFAKKYNPNYLGLGVETNILYEKSPTDYKTFVNFFSVTYDEVKQVSPKTKIFTVFQLEKIKGLNGGLFGKTNDPEKTSWNLLNDFSKSDLIGFTTYPGLIYKTPSEIPYQYYSDISFQSKKPIAFTEIGWQSENIGSWENNETNQSDFITTFFSLTKDLNKKLAIWSFLYDQNTSNPFNNMGLIRQNGEEKFSWTTWRTIK